LTPNEKSMIDQGFANKDNPLLKGTISSRMKSELANATPEKKRAVKAYLDSKGYDPRDFGINPKELG
jgi:hypothetical protein